MTQKNTEIRKVYIVLSYTGTWFSKFLKLFLKNKYVHVSISLDKSFKKVYSFGRKNPKTMFPCGFIKEDFKNVTKVFKNSICQVYELELDTEKYFRLEQEINKYIQNKNNYYYNILGLVPLNFNIKFPRRRHLVCSQFVGKVIQDAGICDLEKDFSLVKPRDIIKMNNMKKVYEGSLANIDRSFKK